ncbi:site-specific integrase [Microbulbifer epialgicus]|uniref:Site-specific integrase n=1 Tax=Microbulbifer epialgicus TaxID=393907 RepID=A0ABV4P5Q4_9GAMM
MAVEKLFTEQELQLLLDMNAAPPHGQRNAALIIGAVYWGLTPSELSLLQLQHVMAQSGEFYRIWTLPESVSYNGEARELHTEDHVLPFFEAYMESRVDRRLFRSNKSWYRHSDPESYFFLNDRNKEFSLSLRSKGSNDRQPVSMNSKLKQLIAKTSIQGAKPSSFRDTFIKNMYEAGCGYKDLMAVSGIKGKETLDRKIRPRERELEKIFRDLFNKVRVPKSN